MSRAENPIHSWLTLLVCLAVFIPSCSKPIPDDWTQLVPDRTPFLLIPEENQTLRQQLQQPWMPVLEDMTPAAIQLTGNLLESAEFNPRLHALLLYPNSSTELKPVWIVESASGSASRFLQRFQPEFSQNRYQFLDYTIEILSFSERTFYLLEIGPLTLLTESSLAIEDMLRTWSGILPGMDLSNTSAKPGSYLINTPNLERWVEQIADITYRPSLQGLFDGTTPLSLHAGNPPESLGNLSWILRGEMQVLPERSVLAHAISTPAEPFLLDRYIPIGAAGFSIFFLEPRRLPTAEPLTDLDRKLESDTEQWQEIASTLHSELAFVTFAESGFMSASEYLFLRRLSDPDRLEAILQELAEEGLIQQPNENLYHISSTWLGELLGSELSSLSGFYLAVHNEVVALSRSNSVVVGVGSDYNRRRVVYYDDSYTDLRRDIDRPLSSFTYLDAPSFNTFLQPWLFPQNELAALTSGLDIITLSTYRETEREPLEITIANHFREESRDPFTERWTYPLESNLTGPPVLADVAGTAREEIVFATESGAVYVLATDGSPVIQASTNGDQPIGSPVVYDWYGNNQQILMQAAGNKIYAWNEAGSLLPNFPVRLNEQITTPLQVIDVTRNGVAEMVLATADRQVHILNARGNPIDGWPQTTNSVVTSEPLLAQKGDEVSLFAFAENGLHAWSRSGDRRNGFPLFIESKYNGSPVLFEDHVLGSGADGRLYASGVQGLFNEELIASESGDSLRTQSLNVSNSSLTTTPVVSSESVRVNDGNVTATENLILLQSRTGAIQAYNPEGDLRFTESMGQPASESTGPLLVDINGNGRANVVALATSGRLYAWDLASGERFYDLPSSAMSYPLVADLNGDGSREIIARTREGLRVWTIFQ